MKFLTALFLPVVAAYPQMDFGRQERIAKAQNSFPEPFSFDMVKSKVGRKILRDEYGLITKIQDKWWRSLDIERKMAAIRDVIRRKMQNSPRFQGGPRRQRLHALLQELDQVVITLSSWRLYETTRFADFVKGLASGKIRDPKRAHSILDGFDRTTESRFAALNAVFRKSVEKSFKIVREVGLDLGNAIQIIMG